MDGLNDWLIDWLIDSLIVWMIDWWMDGWMDRWIDRCGMDGLIRGSFNVSLVPYLILKWSSNGARASVSPSMANFEEQYSSLKGSPTKAQWLLLLIMCPACFDFMPGSTAWMSLRAPKKLTSYKSFAIFIGVHSSTDVKAMPALLTVTRKNTCSSYWKAWGSGKKLHFFTHSIHLQLWHSDQNMANSFYSLHHSSSSPEHQYHGNPLLLTTRKKSLI